MNKELFVKNLTDCITTLDEALNAFTAGLSPENMFHELTWADDTFERAARRKVFTHVLRTVRQANANRDINFDVKAWIVKNTIQSARDRSKSTSTCTNLIARCETEAWAAAAELAEMCP